METMRYPGVNFPVSGLAAIIVTGMLLIFNYNLSKIYIPKDNITKPEPFNIPYPQTPEPVEIEETDAIADEPVIPTKQNTGPENTAPPVTVAPIPATGIERPGDIVITRVKPDINLKPMYVPDHFVPAQVDQSPRVIRPVPPVYPHQATVNGIEGRVVLRFIVDENGEVQTPEVVKAEPEGVFEEAALAAIIKYKFMPARIGNRNVKCSAVMPIGFRIK